MLRGRSFNICDDLLSKSIFWLLLNPELIEVILQEIFMH